MRQNKFYGILICLAFLLLVGCSEESTQPPVDESQDFTITIENISTQFGIMSNGAFNTPDGAAGPGPLLPGNTYNFSFSAAPGSKLSLATMFVQSNDLFYAPDEAGIDLFDNSGNPITGDRTATLSLWDAGTEINQAPGIGNDQAPRQSGPDTGADDPDNIVRLVNDGFTYPDNSDAIRLTINSTGNNEFQAVIENTGTAYQFAASGIFNTPVGAGGPAPIGPGSAYEINFSAALGSKLSFATMFIPSNDFFIGPDEDGIDLFDPSGNPISGDITGQMALWDAGTEVNQEPGLGPDQAQRQAGPNTGAPDPDNTVRLAPDTFNNLPALSDVVQVTLTASGDNDFTLRIENVSDTTTLATSDGQTQAVPLSPGAWVVHSDPAPLFTIGQPDAGNGLEGIAEDGSPAALGGYLDSNSGVTVILSPGAWAVHMADAPFFTVGQADRGDGLEEIAEDGNPAPLDASLDTMSGLTVPFSPGLYVVHSSNNPVFESGQADRGEGLEAIAEDGDPSGLFASLDGRSGLSVGIFNTPVGASAPGPIGAGQSYSFDLTATNGQRLSFALMFIQSNDLFYSPDGNGIALFDNNGNPITGDVTIQVQLWDAGTEVNEAPGIGPNQAPRQSGPDTGNDENGVVRVVNDGFTYPALNSVLRVTVSPQ